MPTKAKQYRVLIGINYPPTGKGDPVRAEPGDLVADLPAKSVPWLLQQGVVEEVEQP